MTTRAQNYLNTLGQVDAAKAAGASLLHICPIDDVAAIEVRAALADATLATEEIAGGLYVRLSPGDTVYSPVAPVIEVTPRQLRLALLTSGITPAAVAGVIGQLPEPQRTAALIEWEYATVMRRDHPLIGSLAGALGKTNADIDALFAAAGGIV
jgi:hypothetical protein